MVHKGGGILGRTAGVGWVLQGRGGAGQQVGGRRVQQPWPLTTRYAVCWDCDSRAPTGSASRPFNGCAVGACFVAGQLRAERGSNHPPAHPPAHRPPAHPPALHTPQMMACWGALARCLSQTFRTAGCSCKRCASVGSPGCTMARPLRAHMGHPAEHHLINAAARWEQQGSVDVSRFPAVCGDMRRARRARAGRRWVMQQWLVVGRKHIECPQHWAEMSLG